jgi:hypothetical protein
MIPAPDLHAEAREELRERLRKSAVLSSLECLAKFDPDPEGRAYARRRYLDLSDKRNVLDLEARRD